MPGLQLALSTLLSEQDLAAKLSKDAKNLVIQWELTLFSVLTPERDDAGVERLRAGLGPRAVDAVADVALDRES